MVDSPRVKNETFTRSTEQLLCLQQIYYDRPLSTLSFVVAAAPDAAVVVNVRRRLYHYVVYTILALNVVITSSCLS
jgi:hypothetical protein